MPVDMAARICLASSPPLCSFLSNYDNCRLSSAATLLPHFQPLRPCLATSHCGNTFASGCIITTATTNSTTATADSTHMWLRKKKKKSVVFADSQGLALTVVNVFNKADEDLLTELQFHLSNLEVNASGVNPRDSKYSAGVVLDFTQPAADYLDLRNRLKMQQVCLETCSVQEHQISGTVQVRNFCFEKSVSVRITFDSWRSFQDISCQYLNNVYSDPDTDTFSFSIKVPEVIEPSKRVEFCLQYQTQDQNFWDNNLGNNYRLAVTDPNGSLTQVAERTAKLEVQRGHGGEKRDFNPFGSPTSAGFFPEWQSWDHLETRAPYW